MQIFRIVNLHTDLNIPVVQFEVSRDVLKRTTLRLRYEFELVMIMVVVVAATRLEPEIYCSVGNASGAINKLAIIPFEPHTALRETCCGAMG